MIDNFDDFKNDYETIVFEKTYEDHNGNTFNTVSFERPGKKISIKKTIFRKGVQYNLKRYVKYKAIYKCEKVAEKQID